MNLIEEGMVIKNYHGDEVVVESVEKGVHGLLVKGSCGVYPFETYCPWELPPSEPTWPESLNWYGWSNRSYMSLPTGLKLGDVCFSGHQGESVAEYDTEWERTIEAIRKEEIDLTEST